MIRKGYTLESLRPGLEFIFWSTGQKGRVKKYILFRQMELMPNVYSMGFGDLMKDGSVNDSIVTNNGDFEMVVGALLASINSFFEEFPEMSVFIVGNSPSRTRLYRIIISRNLELIRSRFSVFGLINNEWEVFKSDRPFEGYLIQLRTVVDLKYENANDKDI